jgi:hypothetical protein
MIFDPRLVWFIQENRDDRRAVPAVEDALDEFRTILKLGAWTRTQIERGATVGNAIASGFSGHEIRRVKRRKSKSRVSG